MVSSSGERNPVERLAEEFAERLRRGEQPAVSEYTAKYPQYAEQIRELFPALVMMEHLKPTGGDLAGSYSGPEHAAHLECLGDYRIVREVGRGGMGVVYEAEQQALGRRVALKVLPPHAVHDRDKLRRFEREARSAARLHHTNIVPVFGVGCHQGTHYYVMQFIQGLGLDDVLAELRRLRRARASGSGPITGNGVDALPAAGIAEALLTGQFTAAGAAANESSADASDGIGEPTKRTGPAHEAEAESKAPSSVVLPGESGPSKLSESGRPYWRSVARIGIQASEALAYAHSQGILHRDIKPSNLLLDTWGTVWVNDFGLAKSEDSEDLTHTGDIIGTIRYLAPERFQGKADARSDVYALGLTLYELLTLGPAFDETDRNKLIAQVMHAEPPRPRQLCPEVPRDLETIVLKAMDRDPSRRYQTATELAEDLKRHVAGEPIQARRVTAWQRLVLWAKRKPAAAGLLVVSGLAALALVGAVVAVFYNAKLQQAHQTAIAALDEAHLARANAGWLSENMAHVESLLDSCAPDRRGWEWHYLKRLCHADLLTLKGHTGTIKGVAFSPDGARLASASEDGTVKLWDVTSGQVVRTLTGHRAEVNGVAFSPDSTRLASAGGDGTVRIWDAATGSQLIILRDEPPKVFSVFTVAFSPDGTRVAAGGWAATLNVWDAATGRKLFSPTGHGSNIHSVVFSPDGSRLAAGSRDMTVMIWDAMTGERLHRLKGHTSGVYSVDFSPDGARLASASTDGAVKVWDARRGQELYTFKGHGSSVQSVAFSPDGTRLASASADGAIKIWDASNGQLAFTQLGHTSIVNGLAFSPDGTRIASGSADQTVKLWDATTGPVPRIFTGYAGSLRRVPFSPDGTLLASSGGIVKVWDTETCQESLVLEAKNSDPWGVAFRPDGARLIATCFDGTVKSWDPHTGQQLPELKCHADVYCTAFSPDGNLLATGSTDHTVKVWDANSGRELHTFLGHTATVRGVAFSPDGNFVASASMDKTVRVWNVATGEEALPPLKGHTSWVRGVTFSPDGSRIASCAYDNTMRVWNARTGEEVLPPLTGHTSFVFGIDFSPDGRRIASCSHDQTVKVWDVDTGQDLLTLKGHRDEVQSVAFSPDGTRLASAGQDGTVLIWDARPWTPAAASEREALGLLANLFAKPLCKADVIEHVRTLPAITPQARQLAQKLIDRYRQETDPDRYHRASWAVLREPYLNAFQYRFALRQAETACRLAPQNAQYWTALGAAQYRAGQYTQARATLTQADLLHRIAASLTLSARRFPDVFVTIWQAHSLTRVIAANLAFLGMTYHQLGEEESAHAALARLREIADKPEWANDEAVMSFVREAELVMARKAIPGPAPATKN